VTNTLAYCKHLYITAVKRFIGLAPGTKKKQKNIIGTNLNSIFFKFLSTKIGLSLKKFNLGLKLIKIDGGLSTGLSAPWLLAE
jgi:hypothetical protein